MNISFNSSTPLERFYSNTTFHPNILNRVARCLKPDEWSNVLTLSIPLYKSKCRHLAEVFERRQGDKETQAILGRLLRKDVGEEEAVEFWDLRRIILYDNRRNPAYQISIYTITSVLRDALCLHSKQTVKCILYSSRAREIPFNAMFPYYQGYDGVLKAWRRLDLEAFQKLLDLDEKGSDFSAQALQECLDSMTLRDLDYMEILFQKKWPKGIQTGRESCLFIEPLLKRPNSPACLLGLFRCVVYSLWETPAGLEQILHSERAKDLPQDEVFTVVYNLSGSIGKSTYAPHDIRGRQCDKLALILDFILQTPALIPVDENIEFWEEEIVPRCQGKGVTDEDIQSFGFIELSKKATAILKSTYCFIDEVASSLQQSTRSEPGLLITPPPVELPLQGSTASLGPHPGNSPCASPFGCAEEPLPTP